jgi:hypothetical protein
MWICVDKFPRARARVGARKSGRKMLLFATYYSLNFFVLVYNFGLFVNYNSLVKYIEDEGVRYFL